MKAHLKNAVITTAIVLASIYALRKLAVTRNIVDTALPQAQMFVVDFVFDNNLSGALPTADAASLEILMTLTAGDNGIAFFELLDTPFNL